MTVKDLKEILESHADDEEVMLTDPGSLWIGKEEVLSVDV